MFLLSGHSLTPARKVPVESMTLNLTERDSTATIAPADMTGIGMTSWFLDENNPGKNIVWRVRSINTSFNEDVQTVQLEHVIGTLKDRILFGEITPAKITGNSRAEKCTAVQAVRYILNQQSDWVLGSFDFSVSNPYKFDGDSLFDALEKVTKTLDDAMWTYNTKVYPFKLNIIRKPDGVDSEMRAARNILAISKSVDKTDMYTRFYPIGKEDLHINGNYKSRNESAYGVIARTETDTSLETKEELVAWAEERLKRHAEPVVTVEVDGLELADATGESMDRYEIGRICRIPLPDFGTTITERITQLNYPDVVHSPQSVRVTLSNASEDVAHMSLTKILSDAEKRSAGGGRGAARQAKERHAWFIDTDTKVGMCAEGIAGVDENGNPAWNRLSEIIVDGEGIHQHVQKVEKGLIAAETRIEANEDSISLEAERRIAQDKSLLGKIQVEANKVGMVVGTKNGENFIKAGEICVAINEDGSTKATIEATKIHLLGQTIAQTITADYIQTKISSINNLQCKTLTATGEIYVVNGASQSTSIRNAYASVAKSTSGNDITLTFTRMNGTSYASDSVTFSKATTLSGAWSSGVQTVTASPQGNTYVTAVEGGDEDWSSGSCTIPIRYSTNGGASWYGTGAYAYAHVTKSDISIPTNWSSSSSDPGADVKVSLNGNYKYHKCTINVHGRTKTLRVYIIT